MSNGRLCMILVVLTLLVVVPLGSAAEPLRYLSPWGGTDLEKEKRILEWASERAGVDVELEAVPGGLTRMVEKLIVYAAAGVSVDISWNHMLFHQTFAAQGKWRDLRPYLQGDRLVDVRLFGEGPMKFYTLTDGSITGLPFRYSTAVLNYNVELFDLAGLPYPNDDWTYEKQFFDAARKLTVDVDSDGTPERWGVWPLRLHDFIWRAWGAEFLMPDMTASGFQADRAAAIDSLQFLRDLYQTYRVAVYAGWTSWKNSNVAMVVENPLLEHSVESVTWDIANIPVGPTGQRISRGAVAGWSIPVWSKNPDEAWKLLRELASKDGQLMYIMEGVGGTRLDSMRDFYIRSYNPQVFTAPVNSASFQNRQVMIEAMSYAEIDPFTTIVGDFFNRRLEPLIGYNGELNRAGRSVVEIVEDVVRLTNAHLAENPVEN